MKLLRLLTACLLPLVSLAAKPSASDRYTKFSTRAQSTNPVKLNDEVYGQLTRAPRDYAVAVLLTALEPRLGCKLCTEFQPEWDILAKSWKKKSDGRLIFGTLDFQNGKDTFKSV